MTSFRKYAIRVIHPGTQKTIGYIGSAKEGEVTLRKTTGKMSDYTIREVAKIKDWSYVPYWMTRQECLKTLATFNNSFHDEYKWLVEDITMNTDQAIA